MRRRLSNHALQRQERRKIGVCPKCYKHIGRGLVTHEKHCKGWH